jgi:hypothetical protein
MFHDPTDLNKLFEIISSSDPNRERPSGKTLPGETPSNKQTRLIDCDIQATTLLNRSQLAPISEEALIPNTRQLNRAKLARDRARKVLLGAGLDFEEVNSSSKKNLIFFIGSYPSPEYLFQVARMLDLLVEKADVCSVGFEGLWGANRLGILEDRYKMLERLLGPKAAFDRRIVEEPLFERLQKYFNQSVCARDGLPVKVFGLDSKTSFVPGMYAVEQYKLVRALLKRVNAIKQKNENVNINTVLGPHGDQVSRSIESCLLRLCEGVSKDEELAALVPEEVPRYSRSHLASVQKIMDYQMNLIDAEERFLILGREKAAQHATNTFSSETGNTVIIASWIHLLELPLKTKMNSLLVHPLKKHHSYRQDHDKQLKTLFELKHMRPFSFFS